MAKISVKNIVDAVEVSTSGKTGKELELVIKQIVSVLNKNKMLNNSEQILGELEKSINRKSGRIKAIISTANSLPKEKKHNLEELIKTKYKAKDIETIYLEDKSLIGGIKIEVGEEVLDKTYKNKLKQLEKHLIRK